MKGKYPGVGREMLWKKEPKMQRKTKKRSEWTVGDKRDSAQKDIGDKNDESSSSHKKEKQPVV